jgi:hypothetical protein
MKRKSVSTIRWILMSLALGFGVVALLTSGMRTFSAPPSSVAVNLDQASNGGIGNPPISPVGWENGNQNGNKAHYNEGESIPYRARITGLTAGQTYRVTFGYDITHSGKHAIDYITSNQRIAETVNPCQNGTTVDVTPCNPGAPGDIPAPTGGTTLKDIAHNSFVSLEGIEGNQQVKIFNGNISDVSFVSEGDPALDQSETTFRVTFTVAAGASNVVVSWGGHIARTFDWGAGQAATGISGSPYHTRVKNIETPKTGGGFNVVSIGNQDRALASSAVQPPGGCTLTNDGTRLCNGGTLVHSFQGTLDTGSTYHFSILSTTGTVSAAIQGGGTNENPGSPPVQATVLSSGVGTYTIRLTISNGAGSSFCDALVTLDQPVTANAGSDQEFCETGGPDFVINGTSSGPAGYTVSWAVTAGPASIKSGGSTNTPTITFSGTGTATVVETATPPAGSSCTAQQSTVHVTMDDAPEADAGPATQDHCADQGQAFTISGASAHVPTGGSFTWELIAGSGSISNGNTLTPTVTLDAGQTTGTLKLTVSGPSGTQCGNATDQVVLTIFSNPSVTISLEDACDASLAQLKANPTGGAGGGNPANYTYQWSKDGGEISGATSQTLHVTAIGSYSVTVKDKSTQTCPASATKSLCFTLP